jgi:hypothetical protein
VEEAEGDGCFEAGVVIVNLTEGDDNSGGPELPWELPENEPL